MTQAELNLYPKDIIEYPDDIAEALLKIIEQFEDIGQDESTAELERTEIKNQLIEGLYHIRTIAENEYNIDYFRVLYCTLAKLAEKYAE